MRYVFAGCVLDTQLYTLCKAGLAIRLRPKAFHVLHYLLEHRDRVVSKDELCAHVWPGQFISDATLEGCIKVARQAIGDSGRAQRLIQSRRGYGYRFVGAVEAGSGAMAPQFQPWSTMAEVVSEDRPRATSPQALGTVAGVAIEGEYKPVTVLCGALAKTPALAACLGPEGLYCLLQAWLVLVQEVVQYYEGTLTPGTGEGMTALFGAPTALEDHARRAVLAALTLRQRVQTHPALSVHGGAITVRMGLHSGLAVAGDLGAAPQRCYTAVGEATSVALQL
jgi:DNA-binding winged helix-turn-helix (wHTH) protein